MIRIGFTGSTPDSPRLRMLPTDTATAVRPCANSEIVESAMVTVSGGQR